MNWQTMRSSDAVAEAIDALAAGGAAARTNYFRQPLAAAEVLVGRTQESLVLLARELDFIRLYFVTRNTADLRLAVAGTPTDADVIVNHIHKEDDAGVSEAFAGFAWYSTYERMINRAAGARPRHEDVVFAADADADEVSSLLATTFDKYTDHLPSHDALRARIAGEEVLVRRSNDRITGFVIFAVDGGVANFNYVYNDRDAGHDATALIDTFYAVLHDRGIRRTFLWVDARKSGVVRLYERFGWKRDGLRATYYLRKACAA